MSKKLRLDKFLCESGVAGSRSQAKRFILKGYVLVNGKVIRDPAFKVSDEDEVIFESEILKRAPDKVYILLNKPEGYVSSTSDPQNPTVINLLYGANKIEDLFPVGRLDKDATGLLLLTNDGELAHKLTHPKYKVEKEYLVEVKGELKDEDINKALNGIKYFDKKKKKEGIYKPKSIEVIEKKDGKTLLKIVLTEGKYHEIKNIFKNLGYDVLSIKRVRFGPIKLQNLPVGKWRYLSNEEVESLKKEVKK